MKRIDDNSDISDISVHPNDFRILARSESLYSDLKDSPNISSFFKKNKKNMIPRNLPMHLEMLLKEKGITKADVYRGSNLERKYVYQIFSGEKNPSRDKLIALAFGLQLSDEETQTMLKLSGNRELYVRDERDAIILFCIQRNKTIFETNDLLYSYGFELLGNMNE